MNYRNRELSAPVPATWAELPESIRCSLQGKLAGLYGYGEDEAAFAAAAQDKREALVLLMRRLVGLDLWKHVGKIVNVYGQGGVGMYFSATPYFYSALRRRSDFSQKFARHGDNSGGFLEKNRRRASLHFLYIDNDSGARDWHVHLDFYGPRGSFFSTTQHLYHERWRKFTPDWQIMKEFVTEEILENADVTQQ
jgi:hypothetical protein